MIFEKVKKLIAENLKIDEKLVTLDSDLIQDLRADSLDIVKMIMILEEEYDINIENDDVSSLRTVGDVVAFIERIKK